jgi:glycosyltransferase involved in cell wall biosynthesis
MKNKIGVGIITCNRENFFKKCVDSIPDVDSLVIVNDGEPYDNSIYPDGAEVIQHTKNKCVGVSKNEALRYLIQDGTDHLFLIEDDMLIKNPEVFNQYIKTAETSGIWHLNFGYHGPANKTAEGQKNPRQVVEYDNGIEVALNPNCVGSFSYYLRGVIKHVGYMDERFKNAWEHVEHTYKIIDAGLHPPFWWFADVANSDEYINEQACSEVNSTIRKNDEWTKNMREGMAWYRHKHGIAPVETPDTKPEKVLQILDDIEKKYARKVK